MLQGHLWITQWIWVSSRGYCAMSRQNMCEISTLRQKAICNILMQAAISDWRCLEAGCLWMGGGRLWQTHPAAMDIDYTDGLGAHKEANIVRNTACWSQSRDLCCMAENYDTNQRSKIITYNFTIIRCLWPSLLALCIAWLWTLKPCAL
jgi:hypothetical protein